MKTTKIILTALGITVLLSSQSAMAQVNGDWNIQASGNWSDPTRWTSNPDVPGGNGSIVNLTFDITATRTVTIDTTSRTVGQLTIGDPNGTHAYNLNASGGAGLTFQNGGNAAQLNFTSNALNGIISAPISLADNLVIANNSPNQQTISSGINASTVGLKTIEFAGSGSGLLFLSGAITNGTGQVGIKINNASGGGLMFGNAASTFTGPVDLQAGRMVLIANLGSQPVNITGGSIASNGGNTRSILGNVTLNGTVSLGNATNTGLIYFANAASTLSLLNNSTINTVSAARIDHAITGASGFTKSGSSSLSLYATNSYSGETNVSAGTLIIQAGSINSSSQVTVSGGAVLTNNSSNNFTSYLILEEGATLAGSRAFAPTSLTVLADLTGGVFTTINSGTTSLVKSGSMEFTLSNTTVGDYTIFSGSALSGSFTSMTVGGVALSSLGSGNFGGTIGGFDYTFSNTTNILQVVPEPSTWMLLTCAGLALLLRRRMLRSA